MDIYPEKHLALVRYPTSQESSAYAIINYREQTFTRNLFNNSYDGTFPQLFLGSDKLIAVHSDDPYGPQKVVIADFQGKVLEELYTTDVEKETIGPIGGGGIYAFININDRNTGSVLKTLRIDADTLSLSEY